MKKRIIFVLNTLGWVLLMLALVFFCIRVIGLNPEYYYRLQLKAGADKTAGISQKDMLLLDVNLANYLGGEAESPNAVVEVYGQLQPAFNEKELIHLADCRRLFAPVVNPWLNAFAAVSGVALVFCGWRANKPRVLSVWVAAAVIILPLAVFALWAAVDFSSAFVFFHRLLFTNNLWLLNPVTDLLIRICPASMFAGLGLRIGMSCAAFLLGLPLLLTVLNRISEKRKKDTNEIPQI